MKKGIIEYAVLLVISIGEAYVSTIIDRLKKANLLTVEGTLYPLLSRISNQKLVSHKWIESPSGPPRKYYTLTEKGWKILKQYDQEWESIIYTINFLKKSNE